MKKIASGLVGLIALLHVYFLVLEMFLWTKPMGLKTFGMTQEVANASAVLAGNQGLYNGFLAAGLVWGLFTKRDAQRICTFFLGCIVVAGVYGGLTAKLSILFIQALPALIALVLVRLAGDGEATTKPSS